MANSNLNGVTHEAYPHSDCYSGSKEALIAANLARPEWFPGDPRCPRKHTFTTPDRRVKVSKCNTKKFTVCIDVSEEESANRLQLYESRRAANEAQQQLATLPTSVSAFKSELTKIASLSFGFLRRYAEGGAGGYRATQEILDAIDIAAGQVESAIETGSVAFSARARSQEEQEILAKCGVVVDSASRSFIDGLLKPGPLAGD